MTTRFPDGVTTAKSTETLGEYGLPAPTKWHTYFNDFDTYLASEWTITTTELGAGSATEALHAADGGALRITNAGGDNDNDFLQLAASSFQFEVGKKMVFRSRFSVNDATESDFIMGLQVTDTTPLDTDDGVFFQKDDGDTNLDFHVEKNDTATTVTALTTVSDNTDLDVGFYYDGGSLVSVYVNDALVQSVAATNLPDDVLMRPSFGIQNGTNAAKHMTIDYIFCAKER